MKKIVLVLGLMVACVVSSQAINRVESGVISTINNENVFGHLSAYLNVNEDQATGVKILQRALKAPFHQIVANGGHNPEVIENKVMFFSGENNFVTGYDASTDKIEDMISVGIVDPAKVTRVALQNAASIAGIFLTTEVVIGWDGEDKTDNLSFLEN